MFSLFSPTFLKLSFGPSYTAVGAVGWGKGEPTKGQVHKLSVPWHPLLPDQKLFSLLSWHTRVSEFAGRDDEMGRLREWATSDHPVWVKFVVGEGGVGKSRLGAEFAETMQKENWAAGFGDLRDPHAFPMKEAGTLLIIDYPEEHVSRVKELLKDLTHIGLDGRLRVLFLTRRSPDNWDEVISTANARNIVDTRPVTLGRLDARNAKAVYDSTVREASKELQRYTASGLGPAPIPEEAMTAWLKLAPENDRALFIMAAAVHSAENPDKEIVDFSGREIVTALAEREVDRYQRMADGRKVKDQFALARLLAMAAIADELSVADIQKISESELPVGFQPDADIRGQLMTAGLLIDGKVRAPKPDIVVAAFTVDVLSRRPEHAPEIVWAALKGDIGGGLERIGRLCYDAEIVLGILKPRLSDWLAAAVEGNVDRCSILEEHVSEVNLPLGWLKTAVAVWKTLLDHAEDDAERARLLSNLSEHLSATGDEAGAVAAVQKAMALYRRLVKASPARIEPMMADSLNNLSNRLNATGDRVGALAAIQEAVDLYRRLAEANLARFEPDLATSLNNLSIRLSETDDTAGALAAVQEAVEIYLRLAEADPARFELYLVMSLNSLSNRLSDTGDRAGALNAIQEAVEICRRLAEAKPARFETDLAASLNNLSLRLSDTGDSAAALAANQEAVTIHRRLAETNPARFEPDLATSLYNLGLRLLAMEKHSESVDSFKLAITLIRPYAEKWPGSRHEELLKALERDLKRASNILQS